MVGWQPIGRRCVVVAVVFHLRFVGCLNKRIFIYLFIYIIKKTIQTNQKNIEKYTTIENIQ